MRKVDLYENELLVFDVFFAGIVSMAHCHPGAGVLRDDAVTRYPEGFEVKRLSIEECADLALEMVQVRRRVHADATAEKEQIRKEQQKKAMLELERRRRGPTYEDPFAGFGPNE